MPNGNEPFPEFDRLEKPLRDCDADFDTFAAANGCTLIRNYHNSPSRILRVPLGMQLEGGIEVCPVLRDTRKGWGVGNYFYVVGIDVIRDTDEGRYAAFKSIAEIDPHKMGRIAIKESLEEAWKELPLLARGKLTFYKFPTGPRSHGL